VHNSTDNKENNIGDILKSVRSIIDNHNQQSDVIQEDEDSVLELTTIVKPPENTSSLISDRVKQKAAEEISKFAEIVKEKNLKETQTLDLTVDQLIKPLIKDWLDNNLEHMVEKILKEEIIKIIPKAK